MPPPSWTYPPLTDTGYADRERHAFWAARDPIPAYAARLEAEGLIDADASRCAEARGRGAGRGAGAAVIAAEWPEPEAAGEGVFADEPPRVRVNVLDPARAPGGQSRSTAAASRRRARRSMPPGRRSSKGSRSVLGDALRADPRAFIFGEDVGGPYGNAFLLLRPLLAEFGDRIQNSILAEGAVLGVCVGAALAGQRPIGEMQFNDFVATGFNMLVNNAAKIRYRWGGSVPMVLRMPWGGLRHAGPSTRR